MKRIIFVLVAVLLPLGFINAQYIKFDGVEGEAEASASATTTRTPVDSKGTETETKGHVETEWKVEEGESVDPTPGVEPEEIDYRDEDSDDDGIETTSNNSGDVSGTTTDTENTSGYLKIGDIKGEAQENTNAGIEPDEIDVAVDGGPQESNFAILLSSGNDTEEGEDESASKEMREEKREALQMLKEGLEAEDVPTEEVSLNSGKIKTTHKQEVKLFGIIPVEATAEVEVDAQENVTVKFPWWAFLATGKNKDALGDTIFSTLDRLLGNTVVEAEVN